MAEIKIEITEEMIKSVIREEVKARMVKIDFKCILMSEIQQAVRDNWKELKSDELVKTIKTEELKRNITQCMCDEITQALIREWD